MPPLPSLFHLGHIVSYCAGMVLNEPFAYDYRPWPPFTA